MKSKSSRIAKNALLLMLSRGSEFFLIFVSVVLLARHLGPSEFGDYSFIRGIAFVLAPIIASGTGQVLIRDIAVDKERGPALLSAAFWLIGLVALLVMTLLMLFLLITQTAPYLILAVYLVLLAQIFLLLTKVMGAVFIAHEQVKYLSLVAIFSRVLLVLLFLVVMLAQQRLLGFCIALFAANGAGMISQFIFLRRHLFRPKFSFEGKTVKNLFAESYPFTLSGLIMQLYMYTNIFLLKFYHSATVVSYYRIPQRLAEPFVIMTRSIFAAFLPNLSCLASEHERDSELIATFQVIIKTVLVFGFLSCMIIAVYASQFVDIVFGKEFSGAIPALRIFVWSIVPFTANILFEDMITVLKQQKSLILSYGFGFLANLIMALLLIPDHGAVGAAYAMLIGSIGMFAFNGVILSKLLGWRTVVPPMTVALLAGIIAGIAIFPLKALLGDILTLIAVYSIFLLVLVVGKAYKQQEIEIIQQLGGKVLRKLPIRGLKKNKEFKE